MTLSVIWCTTVWFVAIGSKLMSVMWLWCNNLETMSPLLSLNQLNKPHPVCRAVFCEGYIYLFYFFYIDHHYEPFRINHKMAPTEQKSRHFSTIVVDKIYIKYKIYIYIYFFCLWGYHCHLIKHVAGSHVNWCQVHFIIFFNYVHALEVQCIICGFTYQNRLGRYRI